MDNEVRSGSGQYFFVRIGRLARVQPITRGRWGTGAARHHCATAAAAVRRGGLRHAAAPHRLAQGCSTGGRESGAAAAAALDVSIDDDLRLRC